MTLLRVILVQQARIVRARNLPEFANKLLASPRRAQHLQRPAWSRLGGRYRFDRTVRVGARVSLPGLSRADR